MVAERLLLLSCVACVVRASSDPVLRVASSLAYSGAMAEERINQLASDNRELAHALTNLQGQFQQQAAVQQQLSQLTRALSGLPAALDAGRARRDRCHGNGADPLRCSADI